MKKLLLLVATTSLMLGTITTNQLFNNSKTAAVAPNLLEQKIATIQAKPKPMSTFINSSGSNTWVMLTENNAVYKGVETVVPGIKAAEARFAANQTIVGYARSSRIFTSILVKENVAGGSQFVLYEFYNRGGIGTLDRKNILFNPGVVNEVTAMGMVTVPTGFNAGARYLVAAGISEEDSNNSILNGFIIDGSTSGRAPAFPQDVFVVENTHFQNFSQFYVNFTTSYNERNKMYYSANQYTPSTGQWTYGYVGSLTFPVSLDGQSVTFDPDTDNHIYSSDTGVEDLRFAWYYDERLLAWNGKEDSNQIYWVDTASVVGNNFGQVTAPLLIGGVDFIFNNEGDSQEFTIYGGILGGISAGFNFEWNSKSVSLVPSKTFLRRYNEFFGGHSTTGNYAWRFNENNNTTEVFRLTGL